MSKIQSMASTECTVTFGAEIRVQWTQMQDGSISIFLRPAAGTIEKPEPLRLYSCDTDTLVFRAASIEQPEMCQAISKDTELGQRVCEVIQRDADTGRVQDRLTDCNEPTDGFVFNARKIDQKVEKAWEKSRQSIESSVYQWFKDPSSFFGTAVTTSSEAWSFTSLSDVDIELHRFRSPFHRANLSECLKNRLEEARKGCPALLEQTCRTSVLNLVHPGFNELARKEKRPFYRKFERYIDQGNAILKFASINPGLLLTVAPFMSTKDFDFLFRHSSAPFDVNFPWLSSTVGKDSVRFGPLALRLLAYAQAWPSRPTPESVGPSGLLQRQSVVECRDAASRKRRRQPHSATSQRPPLPTPETSQSDVVDQHGTSFGLNLSDELRSTSDAPLDDSEYLYLLFHVLGGAVPHSLFDRLRSSQLRWKETGMKEEIMAPHAGVDQRLFNIASDEYRLVAALRPFYRQELGESWVYSFESQLRSNVPQMRTSEEKNDWSIRALELITFVFPRQAFDDSPNPTQTVQSLIPLLNHVLQQVAMSSIPEGVRVKVSEALLAASKFSRRIRQQVLPTIVELMKHGLPVHLQAELAHEQSITSRLLADFDQSERIIHNFCCRCGQYKATCIPNFYRRYCPNQVDQRMNAMYGRLHRSHLENLVQCEKYDPAIEQVDYWILPTHPSPLESLVLPSLTVTVCKIFRSQGLFLDVRERLELCLLLPRNSSKVQVLCSLADVYCDLAAACGDVLLSKALQVGRFLIETELKNKSTGCKAFRRLMISAIEIDIKERRYEAARRNALNIKAIFENLSSLDVSDELLHVRVLVASARIRLYNSDYIEAIQEWKTVLARVQKYASFEGEGFTYAVIHLSLSLAYLKTGDGAEACTSFSRATKLLIPGKQDYWLPTLWGWAEETLLKIQSICGWKSDWILTCARTRCAINMDHRMPALAIINPQLASFVGNQQQRSCA